MSVGIPLNASSAVNPGQWGVFFAQAALLAGLVLFLFWLRRWYGLSPLYIALGVMQPIQVELASSVYAELIPGLVVSSGSVVMFTCSLVAILLIYIREDADETRKVIYGLTLANLTVALLYALTDLHLQLPGTVNPRGIPRGLHAVDARVMVAGTLTLFLDAILLVLTYESLRRASRPGFLFLRILVSLSLVLVFDSVVFSAAAFAGTEFFRTVLVSGIVGKLIFAIPYSVLLAWYLWFVERENALPLGEPAPVRDVFHTLTYREKYELEKLASGRMLRESHARQRGILEATMDGIFALDAGGAIIEANPAALRTFGLSRAEAIGRRFADDFLAPASRAGFDGLLMGCEDATARRSDAPRVTTTARRREADEFPIELAVARTEIMGAISYILSFRDVSERQRLLAAFIQSQKLESLGLLAGGLAHDFNNLLTVILGEVELLEKQVAGRADTRDAVSAVKASAQRAARLTGQLLAFARQQVVRTEVVDLGEIVRGLEDMLRRLLGERIRLEVRLAEGLHPVLANQDQIEQVIINLVSNARDAMPDGGLLEIRTFNVNGADHADLVDGPYAACEVRDEGGGIPAELQSRVFEPFFTTKEAGRGTGLGLAASFGIIGQFGGQMEVESKPGGGSAFRFHLPRTERTPLPAVVAATVPETAGATGTHGARTILVIDDDPGLRMLMARMLEGLGYGVLVADTLERALQLAVVEAQPIDLVVADVILHGVPGDQVVERLRRERGPLAALFISGYSRESVLAFDDDEGTGFLQKPFTSRELAEKVGALIGAASARRPEATP